MGRKPVEVKADIGFEVWSDDLNKLFEEAALAMYEIMVDVKRVKPKEEKVIHIKSEEIDMLLHDWLSELLYITDVEGMVFSRFEVNINGSELEGKAFGEPIKPEHNPKTEIKAVTYHKLNVNKENELWRATVILDI